jgi:hypothetical protein
MEPTHCPSALWNTEPSDGSHRFRAIVHLPFRLASQPFTVFTSASASLAICLKYIVDVSDLQTDAGRGGRPSGWEVSARQVLLAACRDDEEARECQGDGETRGRSPTTSGRPCRPSALVSLTETCLAGPPTSSAHASAGKRPSSRPRAPGPRAAVPGWGHPPAAALLHCLPPGRGLVDRRGGRVHVLPLTGPGETIGQALFEFGASDEDLKDPARARCQGRVTVVGPSESAIEVDG